MHSVTGPTRVVAGRYALLDRIGHGAVGTVWRARDLVLGRDVAVKEIDVCGLMTEQEQVVLHERSLREARVAARMNHPGVATVHDVIDSDGGTWIVMELVPARSLTKVLAEEGPMPPARAAKMGMFLVDALASAHEAGIVHRDVKPDNVLLAEDGRPVLTDFGIATMDGDPGLTQAGMVMGTPGFCAPERIRGDPASPASDLWSLGATLYTAVEGRGPFERQGSPMAVLASIVHEDPPPAPSAGALGPVIGALMSRHPERRPGVAAAARLLAAVAAGEDARHGAGAGEDAHHGARAGEDAHNGATVAEGAHPSAATATPTTGPAARRRVAPAVKTTLRFSAVTEQSGEPLHAAGRLPATEPARPRAATTPTAHAATTPTAHAATTPTAHAPATPPPAARRSATGPTPPRTLRPTPTQAAAPEDEAAAPAEGRPTNREPAPPPPSRAGTAPARARPGRHRRRLLRKGV